MSVGSPFHPRTAPLNRKMQWREWSGYFASSAYADAHDIEYNAVREAAALFDVSPLYKYIVSGPDATRLVDRVITRDATKLKVGGVVYSPWCDENGKVVDDGTIHRLGRGPLSLDRRGPAASLAPPEQRRAGRHDHRRIRGDRRAGAAGSALARRPGGRDRRVVRRPRLLQAARVGDRRASRSTCRGPATPATSGYELWLPTASAVDVWDAVMAAGAAYGIRPAGMLALDVVRLEAGLILLEVDYTSARHAMNPDQNYSPVRDRPRAPRRLRQGRLRRAARARARTGGRRSVPTPGRPAARLVRHRGPVLRPRACRRPSARSSIGRPSRSSPAARRWVASRASAGARSSSRPWRSPRVPPKYETLGSRLSVEWTVEGRRGRVGATVVPLPFLDLPRKRA